jgi:hypothetical protein
LQPLRQQIVDGGVVVAQRMHDWRIEASEWRISFVPMMNDKAYVATKPGLHELTAIAW